jgi:DUF917 family protein
VSRQIGVADLDDIAAGAAILGTGGGGDPYIARLLARQALLEYGPVTLVDPDEVPDDAAVFPVGMMGAPTVMIEKLPSGDQAAAAVEALAAFLGRTPTHVTCTEIGGLNALLPFVAAAHLGLPVIDADGMGRAFPELQMVMPSVFGLSASPMSITDEKGNRGIFDTSDNLWAERLARTATVEMGCRATISLYAMSGAQARETLVLRTVSLSARVGATQRQARAAHEDPVAAVVSELGGRELFTGTIVDVGRRTVGGFARGTAALEGVPFGSSEPPSARTHRATLEFQNENLVLSVAPVAGGVGEVLATVPDLICTVEADTGVAVTTELLRYGQRVRVFAAPCDPRWSTPAGLALVGPRYFGYDLDPVSVAAPGSVPELVGRS